VRFRPGKVSGNGALGPQPIAEAGWEVGGKGERRDPRQGSKHSRHTAGRGKKQRVAEAVEGTPVASARQGEKPERCAPHGQSFQGHGQSQEDLASVVH